MAASDEEVIGLLRRESREFCLLEVRHRELSRELDQLVRHHVLTPEEELLKKRLQKQKLAAKDQMNEMVRARREHAQARKRAPRRPASSFAKGA
jgi:uncharacterized protein